MQLRLKNISLLLLMVNASSAFSGTMGTESISTSLHGVYIGGTIGASDLQNKTTHYISPEIHHLGGIGIIGGGFLGYDFSFTPKIKMGLEGFANATGLNTAIQHYDQTTRIQTNSEEMNSRYNLGVRILPGYQFTPDTDGHIIIGYSNAKFKHLDNGTYGFLDTDFNKNGFQGGLGCKSNLSYQHVSLRLDMLYTRYSKQNSTGTGLAGSGSAYQYYTDIFSTLEADLSLIYQFS